MKIKGPTSRKNREKWGTRTRFHGKILCEKRATSPSADQKPLAVIKTWLLVRPFEVAVM